MSDSTQKKVWRNKDDEFHRLDGPAVECANGDKEWWVDGQLHRLDGPAIEYANGDKEWYRNDKIHRLDGPACEYANGDKLWYRNDKIHRLDGPAVEYATGSKEWWVNDTLHRLDGPAIEWFNGDKQWYQAGRRIYHEQATIHLLKTEETSHCGTRLHKSTVDLFLASSYNYEEFLDQACKACWLLWRAEP